MLLKAAIVGCGKIGWSFQDDPGAVRFGVCTHAAAWSALTEVSLTAVADSDLPRAQQCAKRWNVPGVFTDVSDLLRAVNPQIISVASPDETHQPVTRKCLEYPSVRAILVEKPLAGSAAEARELDAIARRLGKTVVVNYIRRFCPYYQQLRTRLTEGEFGELRLARGLYTKGMRHNGSHALDLMQFLMPGLRLESQKSPSWQQRSLVGLSDPPVDVKFTLSQGVSGILHSLPSEEHTVFELDFLFDKARLILTEGGDTVDEHFILDDRPFVGYRSLIPKTRREHVLMNYMSNAARHLLQVSCGKEKNISNIRDSVLLLEQYESLQITKL